MPCNNVLTFLLYLYAINEAFQNIITPLTGMPPYAMSALF